MKVAVGAAAGAIAAGIAYTYLKGQGPKSLVIGGFNMQYGPYKISRIDKGTTGLDPVKKEKILTFNKYCMSKVSEDAPLTPEQALQKIFGIEHSSVGNTYEEGLVNCLRWSNTGGKSTVDVGETFKTYFDADNHELWTSAILDTTGQVAKEIIDTGVDIMALVETSAGIKNSKGDIIPHTDNLMKLIENLNKSQDYNYTVASYAQFTNPAADTMPHLNRGNAIIYNTKTTKHLGTFVIDISSEKRGKVTTRRYPVCLFGQNGPEVLVCAAHVSGYAFKDGNKGGDSQNILVGDKELENVLKVLTRSSEGSSDVSVTIGDKTFSSNSPSLTNELKAMGITTDLPTIVIGDFNQDFNKNTIQYPHTYRFPTFEQHEGETVASKYGFENGYSLAKRIHPTTGHNATIDGFLTKNIKNVTLLSKAYDPGNSTSDHSAVYAKL